jgi:hypothetical protein
MSRLTAFGIAITLAALLGVALAAYARRVADAGHSFHLPRLPAVIVIKTSDSADLQECHRRLDGMVEVIKVIENRRGNKPPTLLEELRYRGPKDNLDNLQEESQ